MMRSNFAIKGSRDYISGSLMLDFIIDELRPDPRDLEIVFYKKTLNDCVFVTGEPPTGMPLVGRYRDPEGQVDIFETPDVVERRVEYPEQLIVAACHFQGNNAQVPAEVADFSFIEKLVAAYKHMLQQVYGSQAHKFIFVQLKLSRIPKGAFAVEHERKMGANFYQAAVLEGEHRLGTVHFGEW
jgi:hypothetical protein